MIEIDVTCITDLEPKFIYLDEPACRHDHLSVTHYSDLAELVCEECDAIWHGEDAKKIIERKRHERDND